MEWSMSEIFNSEEEILASSNYDTIRMYIVEKTTSNVEEDELTAVRWEDGWSNTQRSERVAEFSAVCLFFARSIVDFQGSKVRMT